MSTQRQEAIDRRQDAPLFGSTWIALFLLIRRAWASAR
jgi:hypothetical protein